MTDWVPIRTYGMRKEGNTIKDSLFFRIGAMVGISFLVLLAYAVSTESETSKCEGYPSIFSYPYELTYRYAKENKELYSDCIFYDDSEGQENAIERCKAFFESVARKQSAMIRVFSEMEEGGIYIHDLVYDPERDVFIIADDVTRNSQNGSHAVEVYQVKKLKIEMSSNYLSILGIISESDNTSIPVVIANYPVSQERLSEYAKAFQKVADVQLGTRSWGDE